MKNENTAVTAKLAIARTVLTDGEFNRKVELSSGGNRRGSEDNFQNMEISDILIENKTLSRTEFDFSAMKNCTFSGVNFEGTEFKFCDLDNVTFYRCNLHRSGFDFASMTNVKFVSCQLDSSSFDFASGNASFEMCKIHGVEFHHAGGAFTFNSCSGEAAEFNFCPAFTIYAENCDFHRAYFLDGKITGEMKNCIFTDADFYGLDATELAFVDCRMREINIGGSVGINIADEKDDDDFDFDI